MLFTNETETDIFAVQTPDFSSSFEPASFAEEEYEKTLKLLEGIYPENN